jgi:hypothetical protein
MLTLTILCAQEAKASKDAADLAQKKLLEAQQVL